MDPNPGGKKHVDPVDPQHCLEVLLLLQIGLPADEKGGAHVQVELAEAVPLRQVGVPQAHRGAQRQLAQEKVVHPAEGELEVLHLVGDDVVVQAQVHAFQQLFQLPDLHLQQHNSTFFLISYY